MSRMRVELSCRAVGAKGPGVRGSGDIECFMAIPDIGRSVKPISTRFVDYAYHRFFRPSYGPVLRGWSSDNDKSGLSGIKKDSTLSISRCFPPNSSDLFAKAHLLSPFVQENRSMDTFSRKIVLKSMWIINQLNRIQYFVWCRTLSKFHRGFMIQNKWLLNLQLDKKYFEILKASIFPKIEKVYFDSAEL